MADHLDAPGLTSPAMDARVDITDLYAFQKPDDASKSILVLNVNPLAPTFFEEFRSDARYELLVDTDGDARPNIKFRITFSRKNNDEQFARVVRIANDEHSRDGDSDAESLDVHYDDPDDRARVIVADAPV